MEEQYETNRDRSANNAKIRDTSAPGEYVAPGVPIVRANTPRPMPFGLLPSKTELPLAPSGAFPAEAPDAPPVPEEPGDENAQESSNSAPESASRALVGEFSWLFEYALDMDPVLLNRPERLDGSAFAYGPAVLSGYRLVFEGLDTRTGQVLPSLAAAPDQPEAEVWGILYRVPRRVTRREEKRASMLDRVHHVESFVPLEIQVRDIYRQREIACFTYTASQATRQQVNKLPQAERIPEPAYLQRLLQTARRQKLPTSYLRSLEALVPAVLPAANPLPTTPPEHTTDPLPVVLPERELRGRATSSAELLLPDTPVESQPGPWEAPYPAYLERWMMSFALYVCLLLLGTLMLAIVQGLGFWPEVFNENFTPLGTPWYVLLYGLLGGCISCIISLSRPRFTWPPNFVVLTWFIRPFLGATLGALAYLFLSSGVIVLNTHSAQHFALCSLAGALAGLCEGRLLFGKRTANTLQLEDALKKRVQ